MSETATETDIDNRDSEPAPIEFEPPFELDERPAPQDLPEKNFQYESIEEVIKAQSADGKEWVRLAESSGREYLNNSTKESYYEDKENVVLSRERDGEVLDDLFKQGFSIKERSGGNQTIRETYFADATGKLSYAIDILSLNEDIALTTDDESAVLDEVSTLTEDDEPTSSNQALSFGTAQVKETQAIYATATAARELEAPILESSSIQITENEKMEAEATVEIVDRESVERSAVPEHKTVTPIEQSFFIPAELENKTAIAEAKPEVSISVEKNAEVGRDIQEFGIALVEEGVEIEPVVSKVTFNIAVSAEVDPEVSLEMVAEDAPKVTFAATERLRTTENEYVENVENEEGITLVDINDPITEPPQAKVTFASEVLAEAGAENVFGMGKVTLEKVTFPVGEVVETTPAKVTLATVEAEGSVELAQDAEISAVVEVEETAVKETADNQATIVSEARVEATKAVENTTEAEDVGVVVEKVLTVVDTESKMEKQLIASKVEPMVIVDRIVMNNERSERLVVEPREVKVNLQAEAPVESDRVVLFKRAEPAEPAPEANETLRAEQVIVEPSPRVEQLSNNQSPIQNDSQAIAEDEELTPQPVGISLAA